MHLREGGKGVSTNGREIGGPGREEEAATFDAGVTDGEGDSEPEGERNKVRGGGGATSGQRRW